MESIKQVGIWIRVSTEDQAQGDSPEHHEKRARLYAESKGWTVTEVYHLEAVSGKAVMHHPEARRMLEDIGKGHITGLIFSKLARLARNTKELLEFADIFRECDADLISLQESIDTSTPAGRLFYTMIAAMAQWEREEIADRITASVAIRAKLGKPLGGQAPYGYRWVDKVLVPDPVEAPIRKLMYELFLEHRRRRTVARVLTEMGYRTRNGSQFTDTTVKRLLLDPVAKGTKRGNYSKYRDNHSEIPEGAIYYSDVEPIISEELWNQCNAILETQMKGRKKPAKKAVHLFAGVTYCGCGGKMYVPSNMNKYTCVKCRNKIGIDDLEEVFHQQLKAFYFSPDEIANYLKQADKVIAEKEDLLKAVTDEEDKIRQEMAKVYKLYVSDEISPKGFGDCYRPLEERLSQVGERIPELQAEIDFLKIQHLSSDQMFHDARDLYTRWPDLSKEEKRGIIEHITEQIVVTDDEVTITLAYLPAHSELIANEQQNLLVALPFCNVVLNAQKPILKGYPVEVKTIGDRIKKHRLDLGLKQKDVADQLGVSISNIAYFERNAAFPSLSLMQKVTSFLGYNPYGDLITLEASARLKAARERLGLEVNDAAKLLNVTPAILGRWERGKGMSKKTDWRVLDNFILSACRVEKT